MADCQQNKYDLRNGWTLHTEHEPTETFGDGGYWYWALTREQEESINELSRSRLQSAMFGPFESEADARARGMTFWDRMLGHPKEWDALISAHDKEWEREKIASGEWEEIFGNYRS